MEFDGNISKVQGTLVSLGSREMLNKPDVRLAAVETLKSAIQDLPDDAKQKVTFFMVLNTQLKCLDQLKNDDFVGLFTGVTPLIQKDSLIDYIYQLKLDPHLCRVVENCPGVISVELLEVVIEKFKQPGFHKTEFGVEYIYRLPSSIFVKICKIEKGNHSWDNSSKQLLSHFKEAYDLSRSVVITSMKITSDNLMSFVASNLYHFFRMVLLCLDLVEKPQSEFLDDPLHKISVNLTCDCPKALNPMNEGIDHIFNKFDEILMNLTVDMWMALSECHLDESSTQSLQVLIGNTIYQVNEKIKGSCVSSSVMNCLSSLGIKPKNESDLIAEAEVDEVVANVEKGKVDWFKALIRHPSLPQERPLTCLLNNLHLANDEDLGAILNISFEFIQGHHGEESEVMDSMKNLFLGVVRQLKDFFQVLEMVFQDHRPDLLSTPTTKEDLVETFNKISGEKKVPVGDLVSLCVQSPEETLKNICHVAAYDANQIEFSVEVLKVLQPAYAGKISRLDTVLLGDEFLEELTGKEKQTFISLVRRLAKEELLGETFTKCLLQLLKSDLERKRLEMTVFYLEILKAVFEMEAFALDKVVFLVYMSGVLDKLSWDMWTFSPLKVDAKVLAGAMVTSTLRKELSEDGKKLNWARREIEKCWEVNQAYFYDLWVRCGQEWVGSSSLHSYMLGLIHTRERMAPLRNILGEACKEPGMKTSMVLAFITLLPVLTFPECNSIFSHLVVVLGETKPKSEDWVAYHDALDIFGSALYFLSVTLMADPEIYPCYEYCLRNFGRLVQMHASKMRGESSVGILKRIFSILKTIEDDSKRRSASLSLSPVLLELVDQMKKDWSEVHRKEIEVLAAAMDVKEVAEAIVKRLA